MNTNNPSKAIIKVTVWGMIINILLSLLKFFMGIFGSSQALIADAIHSLSDLTTDLLILFGVRYWTAPADENHPYGHWRIENIVSAIIGILLAAIASGMAYHSVLNIRIEHSAPEKYTVLAAIISIVAKEMLFQWTIRTGKKYNSPSLIANAWHHRSDSFSSIPVALTVFISAFFKNWFFLDDLGAFLVSMFILHASWKIIKSAFSILSDEGASEKIRIQIEEIVKNIIEVESVHAIRSRKAGPGYFVDLHIMVNGQMTVKQGHEIAKIVKNHLLEKGPDIMDVLIHIEPSDEIALK